MKRCICLLAALVLLCGCGAEPPAATVPQGTTVPRETTAPVEVVVPAPPKQTRPVQEPEGRIISIEDPETMIYAGPAFRSGAVRMVEESGLYTIVEEQTDMDGNLWGRLKSGAGWLCLTEPALAPIHADYAEETFNAYEAYWCDETDYITAIGFTPTQTLTNVEFGTLDWFETESWQMNEVLYAMEELDPDRCFLAQVVFYGDMTTYGIRFTDENGEIRQYAISISGKDGSLLCTEYQ